MLPGFLLAARVLTFESNPAHEPPALLPLAIAAGPTLSSPLLRASSCVGGAGTGAPTACPRLPIAKANSAGDFDTPPRLVPDGTPDAAAEGSAFFHAARARTFFEALAGAPIPNDVDVVVGLDEPTSFYQDHTVWLGRGIARDFAYDGDLVSHEMTHAMLDGTLHARGFRRTTYGASVEPEALAEGIADYFAAVMTKDPLLGEWASGEPGASNAYRALTDVTTCPAAINGFSHDESTMISGALWSARAASSVPADFDRALYAAIARAPARTDIGYSDIAENLPASVTAELGRRAYGCTPILELPLRATHGAFYAPGTAAIPGGDVAPGILQVRADLPAGTTRLAVDLQIIGIGADPFAPSVAVSWDTELRWTDARSNASIVVEATGDTLAHADLDVPPGAHIAYLQIVNRSANDGAYDYVTATPSSGPAEPAHEAEPTYEARGSGCAISRGESEPGKSDLSMSALFTSALAFVFTARRNKGGTGCRNRRAAGHSSTSSRSRR